MQSLSKHKSLVTHKRILSVPLEKSGNSTQNKSQFVQTFTKEPAIFIRKLFKCHNNNTSLQQQFKNYIANRRGKIQLKPIEPKNSLNSTQKIRKLSKTGLNKSAICIKNKKFTLQEFLNKSKYNDILKTRHLLEKSTENPKSSTFDYKSEPKFAKLDKYLKQNFGTKSSGKFAKLDFPRPYNNTDFSKHNLASKSYYEIYTKINK